MDNDMDGLIEPSEERRFIRSDDPISTRHRGPSKADVDDLRRMAADPGFVPAVENERFTTAEKRAIIDGSAFPCWKGTFVANRGNEVHFISCPIIPYCDYRQKNCIMGKIMQDALPAFSTPVPSEFVPNDAQLNHANEYKNDDDGYVDLKNMRVLALKAPLYKNRFIFYIINAIHAMERSTKSTPDRPTLFDIQQLFVLSGISNDMVREGVKTSIRIGIVNKKDGRFMSYHLRSDAWPCAFGLHVVGWKGTGKQLVPVICSAGDYPGCIVEGKCRFDAERDRIREMIASGAIRDLAGKEYARPATEASK